MELSERLGQRLDLADFDLVSDEPEERSVTARLIALIAKVTGGEAGALTPEQTLDDAAVSSLDRIELAVRVEEEFGARAEDGPFPDNPTIAELAEWLA